MTEHHTRRTPQPPVDVPNLLQPTPSVVVEGPRTDPALTRPAPATRARTAPAPADAAPKAPAPEDRAPAADRTPRPADTTPVHVRRVQAGPSAPVHVRPVTPAGGPSAPTAPEPPVAAPPRTDTPREAPAPAPTGPATPMDALSAPTAPPMPAADAPTAPPMPAGDGPTGDAPLPDRGPGHSRPTATPAPADPVRDEPPSAEPVRDDAPAPVREDAPHPVRDDAPGPAPEPPAADRTLCAEALSAEALRLGEPGPSAAEGAPVSESSGGPAPDAARPGAVEAPEEQPRATGRHRAPEPGRDAEPSLLPDPADQKPEARSAEAPDAGAPEAEVPDVEAPEAEVQAAVQAETHAPDTPQSAAPSSVGPQPGGPAAPMSQAPMAPVPGTAPAAVVPTSTEQPASAYAPRADGPAVVPVSAPEETASLRAVVPQAVAAPAPDAIGVPAPTAVPGAVPSLVEAPGSEPYGAAPASGQEPHDPAPEGGPEPYNPSRPGGVAALRSAGVAGHRKQPRTGDAPAPQPRSGRARPQGRTDARAGSAPDASAAGTRAKGGRRGRHAGARRGTVPDAAPVEREGVALPGWVGLAAGAVALAACGFAAWWAGALPEGLGRVLGLPFRPYRGLPVGTSALLTCGLLLAMFAFGGLVRGRVGYASVLTLFGDYRGTVRRTGLLWVSPLLLRRRLDVRLRHWRSEPLPAVDANGTALRVVVLVVWRVRDTVRAALAVADHERYLREQVEAALARVLSRLPADVFHGGEPTLRDADAVGEAMTRMVAAECAPVGIEVFSAQPTRIEYAPEIAAAMRRRRIAAIDAQHRDAVLGSVVDAVDDMMRRLTERGLVELDDYERKDLVRDLTVAFYTGHALPAAAERGA
ncbi:SPFH domain-containing protein [Streptomyces sp. NPDC095602]|uniref:SPFH domain-containing protein n=1 Tax=Streptomyces sp. NPDC095602 TaxID=3155819 RepID=UPI00331A491B